MAKKRKTVKRRKSSSYMMVIRVSVPARYADRMKVSRVEGILPEAGPPHSLEVLSAYYDRPGQPNAR